MWGGVVLIVLIFVLKVHEVIALLLSGVNESEKVVYLRRWCTVENRLLCFPGFLEMRLENKPFGSHRRPIC